MSFVIARNSGNVNADNAFLCGLLHDIGRLYILTKATRYPKLLGDPQSLKTVQDQWYASVGKSIIEAWGFSSEIANSLDDEDRVTSRGGPPGLVDVVSLAKLVLTVDEPAEDAAFADIAGKLNVSAETLPLILEAQHLHAQSMLQSVGS